MKENLHVVMVPWSAFGHLLPFFHLSIALAKSQIHVSFISTPKNILRLPKIPPNLSSFINLISFPLPKLDHNLLPEGAEATSDLPTEKVQYLKQATDLLRHPIKKFIADNSPDWIIVDFNAYWVSEISQVPIIMFWILSAVSLLYLYPPIITQPSPESMASPPEWVDFSTTVTYSSYEAKFMFSHLYEKRASGMGDSERFFTVIKYSKAVAYRSCEEIEDEYLSLCKKVIPSPGISIGLLPPEKPHMESNRDLPIFKWLDKQNVKSVVFVAFGSELNLTKDQIHEIANGLEISKVQFLWILRKPNWKNDDSNILPSGFCERTSERGFVSFEWAPQLEILAHPAIGGCLVHGGWGSIIESLQFGHCLIILPFVIDQPLNAKLLVEKGLALEIRRNEIDGSFCGKDIAGKLREAMLSDGGERVRRRVGEAAAIVGDKKLQEDYYVGVATAFAARDILGNVLSGLSMQFSQPFSLGDTIKAGTIEGQVVEMGLMTTSLLSAEKFPIIVPNSLFSSQVIVNKSRAQWRAITNKIPLQVDDLSRLSEISNGIKNMLKAHPKVFLEKEAPYCFLSRIESAYAELTMGCNLIKMSTTNELYSAKDDILLRSVDIIKEHGASLGSTASDWTSR